MFCKMLTLKQKNNMLRVPVRFDENQVEEFNRRMNDVIKSEREMKREQTQAAAESYGKCIKALYNLVFGVAQAGAIEGFYGDDVLLMVSTINPFIVSKVLPAVRRASARNTEKAKREFLKNQRRAIHEVVR